MSPKLGHLANIQPPNLPDPKPARCPKNRDTCQTFSPQTSQMSLKLGHLSNIRAPNLPDVPLKGTPGKHPGLKPARCPQNWDTCQTFSPQTSQMSLKQGHLSNIRAQNLPDVPLKGTPVKHQGPKPVRCPSKRDTCQTFSPQTSPMSLKLGHLSNTQPPNLPDVPKTGTPGKHSVPKPPRCPSKRDTCQTSGPKTCPMSLKQGHRAIFWDYEAFE